MPASEESVSSGSRLPRPGGRSARVVDAVLRSTLEVLAEHGWAGLQVDAVAERAGVHKTTIYRRWPTRGALLAAALSATPFRAHGPSTPDTGTLHGDLAVLAGDLATVARAPRTRQIIRALQAAAGEPELAAAYNAFYERRVEATAGAVRAAITRGEVAAGTDAELIATLFVGAVRLHVVERGIRPAAPWYDDLVDAVAAAAGVSRPPARSGSSPTAPRRARRSSGSTSRT